MARFFDAFVRNDLQICFFCHVLGTLLCSLFSSVLGISSVCLTMLFKYISISVNGNLELAWPTINIFGIEPVTA